MGLRDRIRGRAARVTPQRLKPALRTVVGPKTSREPPTDAAAETRLRSRLHDDPNDAAAFRLLADIVRRRAAEGHEGGDSQRAADDAVWALAEEVAGNHKAWYPLVELARLSLDDDRDGALRRLGTASERDPSGEALAEGIAVLREAGMPSEALGLGVGHWRPSEHTVEAGRHIVYAAADAGRIGEARKYLEVLAQHHDASRVAPLRAELERYVAQADRRRTRS